MMLDYFYGQSGELFAYFRIPKALFQDSRFRQLTTDARTLYGILLDRMSLSAKNSWVDEHGRVYIIYTVREVQESLCCAEHKAVKLFRELEQADLIERKRRGLGRPSLIYVKNFSSGLPKAQIQNCANSNSCAAESAVQVRPKSQSNKTDKNKTERNHPFLPDETDRLTQREQLEDYFYQALEVELLLRLCPDDEDAIYQIVDLLVDTCSTKRKMLRINHNLVYRVQEDGTCTNHVNSPKTKAGIRIIPMLDEVFDAFLEEYQYQKVIGFCTDEIDGYSGFVFCTGDGKVYLPNAINRTIRSICADYNKEEESKAKEENRDPVLLPKFSCHILRHTFCTRFCENETNLKVIQEIMGHADISTTMDVYAEATQEKKKESMTSLQSALLVR